MQARTLALQSSPLRSAGPVHILSTGPTRFMPLKKRTRRILLAIVILLIAAPGTFALWLYREMRSPASHEKAGEYIEIPRRSTPESIANKLLSEGVIRRKWPLLLYIKLTGSAK